MAGVNNVITRGFGSFSNVGDVVTAGFSSGDNNIISDADAAKIASYVWAEILENGKKASTMMRLMLSANTGLVSGMPGEPIFLSNDGSKTRIRMITDENGNRLKVVVLDGD